MSSPLVISFGAPVCTQATERTVLPGVVSGMSCNLPGDVPSSSIDSGGARPCGGESGTPTPTVVGDPSIGASMQPQQGCEGPSSTLESGSDSPPNGDKDASLRAVGAPEMSEVKKKPKKGLFGSLFGAPTGEVEARNASTVSVSVASGSVRAPEMSTGDEVVAVAAADGPGVSSAEVTKSKKGLFGTLFGASKGENEASNAYPRCWWILLSVSSPLALQSPS